MVRPIQTTGVFRVPATIKGKAVNALPVEILAAGSSAHAWTYTTADDSLYCKLVWNPAPMSAQDAEAMGYKAANHGLTEFDNPFIMDCPQYQAWANGCERSHELNNKF
jgi:hypothetical protein